MESPSAGREAGSEEAAQDGGAREREPAAPPRFERPVRVKDVMFPLGDGQFVPGYYMELWIEDSPRSATSSTRSIRRTCCSART